MKKIIFFIGVLVLVLPLNSFSQRVDNAQTACSIHAYVIDKDSNGTNVRSGAGTKFKALGMIKPDEDGVMMEVIGSTGSWLLFTNAETLSGAETFKGKGWIFASMLGTSTRMKAKLYSTPSLKSKSLMTIPGEEELIILGCSADWVKVKYKNTQGWLAPNDQCGNPVTTCV